MPHLKKLLFFLINMNLGGTEKSFLNLLSEIPNNYDIDLLLLENNGELLKEIPSNITVRVIENNVLINEFLKYGNRQFALRELKRGNYYSFLKNIIVFFLYKIKWLSHPYYGISHYVINQTPSYDNAVAFAGIHNFIAYYTLKSITARKKVLWIHFDVNKVISDVRFGKKFYSLFNQIVCVSENARLNFIKMFPRSEAKTIVFQNKVSKELLHQKSQLPESFSDRCEGIRLLTLGRLSEEKGQNMIPNVVARLKEDGFKFRWYLIGEGKLRSSIKKNIMDLGLTDNLILLGSRLNPYPYLKDCDLYVQTSLHEGYCITLHEAKIFNKPVVTTNFLSASNLIQNEKDGLIVEITENGIYEGVKRLLSDEKLRRKFSFSTLLQDNITEKWESIFIENQTNTI